MIKDTNAEDEIAKEMTLSGSPPPEQEEEQQEKATAQEANKQIGEHFTPTAPKVKDKSTIFVPRCLFPKEQKGEKSTQEIFKQFVDYLIEHQNEVGRVEVVYTDELNLGTLMLDANLYRRYRQSPKDASHFFASKLFLEDASALRELNNAGIQVKVTRWADWTQLGEHANNMATVKRLIRETQNTGKASLMKQIKGRAGSRLSGIIKDLFPKVESFQSVELMKNHYRNKTLPFLKELATDLQTSSPEQTSANSDSTEPFIQELVSPLHTSIQELERSLNQKKQPRKNDNIQANILQATRAFRDIYLAAQQRYHEAEIAQFLTIAQVAAADFVYYHAEDLGGILNLIVKNHLEEIKQKHSKLLLRHLNQNSFDDKWKLTPTPTAARTSKQAQQFLPATTATSSSAPDTIQTFYDLRESQLYAEAEEFRSYVTQYQDMLQTDPPALNHQSSNAWYYKILATRLEKNASRFQALHACYKTTLCSIDQNYSNPGEELDALNENKHMLMADMKACISASREEATTTIMSEFRALVEQQMNQVARRGARTLPRAHRGDGTNNTNGTRQHQAGLFGDEAGRRRDLRGSVGKQPRSQSPPPKIYKRRTRA